MNVPQRSSLIPMTIIGILFFIFGFVTWLNGSLIPFLKLICRLTNNQALLVTFSFYVAYTVMALPMAALLERIGYKRGMMYGLLCMALGAIMFIPAAEAASFALFLDALFVLATGLTLLQTASNPYVVHIGPIESAAMRISIMGLINKGAGVLAPLLFTALIFTDFAPTAQELSAHEIQTMADRLILPYIGMAAALFLLALFVKLSPLPELSIPQEENRRSCGRRLIDHPNLILGAVALFFYVGIEVIAGDTIGLYGQQLGVKEYTSLTALTMVFMVAGYLLGILAIPRFVSQEKALGISAFAGLLFTLGILASSEQSSLLSRALWSWLGAPEVPDPLVFVALMGLSNALVWPAIWPLALEGLGRLNAKGSALLIMGIAGGALLPLIFGALAEAWQCTQYAYAIGLVCYSVILFYALKGYKMRSWG